MAILWHPVFPSGQHERKLLLAQTLDRTGHRRLVIAHDRTAVRFLIAGVDEGIERKRIILGRGHVLFDQRTENADFNITQWHRQEIVFSSRRGPLESALHEYRLRFHSDWDARGNPRP